MLSLGVFVTSVVVGAFITVKRAVDKQHKELVDHLLVKNDITNKPMKLTDNGRNVSISLL